MNLLLVQKIIGILLMLFSIIMLPPALVDLLYAEQNLRTFLLVFAITLGVGFLLWLPVRAVSQDLRLRDGFLVVVLFWTVLSFFGCLPFLLIDQYQFDIYDAWFESVSGLTTTGATVLSGLDDMPRALLFYRSMLQWLGGLGIVVLALAVLPMLSVGGMQLYRAEIMGPAKDAKLTPRITETAKMLWYIYVALTVLCAVAYYFAGMNVFDAICHSFSTVSIGGFSTHDTSIGYFDSTAVEMVAVVFMLLAGVNFGLHFGALRHRSLIVYVQDSEFKVYILVLFVAVFIAVSYLLASGTYTDIGEALRRGLFQAVSIGTTSGFTISEYTGWPMFLPMFLLSVSFIGGCAGSTGGGMKVIRFLLLVKQGLRELFLLVHPHAEVSVRLGGKAVSARVVDSVWGFFSAYVGILIVMMMLMMMLGHDEITAFSAVAATFNNLGPGLGAVGTNYTGLGDYDKLLLCVSMLLGRLEIFTLLVVFTFSFWRK